MSELIRLRVLLVEDTQKVRDELVNGLSSATYARFEIDVAATFAAAKQFLEQHPGPFYDLILLDYQLDQADGTEVYKLAVDGGTSAFIAMYSQNKSIRLLVGEKYASLGKNIWEPTDVFRNIKRWFDGRPTCKATRDGSCWWRPPPEEITPLLAVPFCCVLLAEDTAYPVRRATHATLLATSGLSFLCTGDEPFRRSVEDRMHAIRGAQCVVADLGPRDDSVLVEVGIATALQKHILLLHPATDAPLRDIPSRCTVLAYSAPLWSDTRIPLRIHQWVTSHAPAPDAPRAITPAARSSRALPLSMEDITELYKIIVHTGAWTTALATLPPTYVDSNLPERGTPILKTLHHLNRADPLEDVLPLTTVLDALKPFVHENVHIETLQVLRSKMPGG